MFCRFPVLIAALVCRGAADGVADDFAVCKLQDPVAVFFGKIPIVRDDDDQLLFGQLFEKPEQLFARLFVERTRRLVRKQDGRVLDERAGNGNALLLTARKLFGRALFVALHADRPQDLRNPPVIPLFPLQFRGEGDILYYIEALEQIVVLKDKSDLPVPIGVPIFLRKVLGRFPVDQQIAFGARVQPAEQIQRGRLAAPRTPEDKIHPAIGKRDGDVLQRLHGHSLLRTIRL